jgi:hypothetical protein
MITSPVAIIRTYPTEAASITLCLAALVYVGSLVGAAVMLASVTGLALLVAIRDAETRRRWIENGHSEPSMSDKERESVGLFLTVLGVFGVGFCEVFWYVGAFIPQPQYGGIIVSTPPAWAVANVSGLVAALAAFRHSPVFCRTILALMFAACVLGLLLLSAVVPVLLAR